MTRSASASVSASSLKGNDASVKGRANPLLIAAALLALGVSVERLVSGPLPDGLEIVSQPAYAGVPQEPEPQLQDTRDAERTMETGLWLAAFGELGIDAPEPAPLDDMIEEEIVEEEIAEEAVDEPVDTTEYWLTGLINGEGQALALVHDGYEEQVVRLGGNLSGGETVVEIERHSILAMRDGETIRIGFPDEEAEDDESW
ncbi:MAG: hypothetical protein RIG84_02065 [Roseovarius sp.]